MISKSLVKQRPFKRIQAMYKAIKWQILIFLMTCSLVGTAQIPKKGMSQNIGHVFGKLINSGGKGIGDASVFIMKPAFDSVSRKAREILLKGTATSANGDFSLNELPVPGKLKLRISIIGYKPFEQEISFLPGNFDKDLGNIQLTEEPKILEGVTVTATKPLMELGADKKIFNVEKNIVSAGGTALDVVRNVPSVQVDIDGNVKMRNATPQIYIDGKPTTVTLDQIPADGISSVEVITNPSAKYDASGANAGILNIVLKKNKRMGYNGNIRAGVDSRGGYNGGMDLNLRQGKFNFSASGMTNQVRNRLTGTTDRRNFSDTSAVNIFQNNINKINGGFSFGKLGLDYFATNRTTISFTGMITYGRFKPEEIIDGRTDSILNTANNKSTYHRISNSDRVINGTTLQLGIKHNFPRPGEEWTADVTWSNRKVEGDGMNTTGYFDGTGNPNGTMLQKNIMGATNKLWLFQTDYTKPFSASSKLEVGLRAQINPVSNDNENYIQYPGGADFELIDAATTDYAITNNVYAAYANYSGAIKKNFTYQLGLRTESSDYTGNLRNTGEKFNNTYAISLFPSLFLTRKLKSDQQLQFSLTRRINRPTFFQLTPYLNYTDELNISQGNPELLPEFTNSAEISYSKTFTANNTFLVSAYYKHTTDLITRYLVKGKSPVSGQEAYINTFINANAAHTYGTELTSINTIRNWWDITMNVNLYSSKIDIKNISAFTQEALWSVFAKLNNNFKLPKNFTIQLSFDYQSKTNLPVANNQGSGSGPAMQAQSASQGFIRPFWGMDMAIKKSFLKDNAASITLSVSDLFRSRKSDQYSEGIGFTQNYYRLNNPQMVRLNFAYRFGKVDRSLFKRKNVKNQGVERLQDM